MKLPSGKGSEDRKKIAAVAVFVLSPLRSFTSSTSTPARPQRQPRLAPGSRGLGTIQPQPANPPSGAAAKPWAQPRPRSTQPCTWTPCWSPSRWSTPAAAAISSPQARRRLCHPQSACLCKAEDGAGAGRCALSAELSPAAAPSAAATHRPQVLRHRDLSEWSAAGLSAA